MGRLYSSTFYALRDTRTPLHYAMVRVGLTLCLGYLFALPLPRLLGIDHNWGVAGLTSSAGIAGWVEFVLLRRGLQRRIGHVEFSAGRILKLWAAALAAAVPAVILERSLHFGHIALRGIAVLILYGVVYLLVAHLLGVGGAMASITERLGLKRR
jgi:putative peptidoglycan lipid II flippase